MERWLCVTWYSVSFFFVLTCAIGVIEHFLHRGLNRTIIPVYDRIKEFSVAILDMQQLLDEEVVLLLLLSLSLLLLLSGVIISCHYSCRWGSSSCCQVSS